MTKIIALVIGFALLCLIPIAPARAATFSVCTLTDLTNAITTANSNTQADVINFNCSATLIFTSQFTILDDGAGNGITINANGNTVIFDEVGDDNRFFVVDTGASLELNGLTLQNGNAAGGGAIVNIVGGTLTISNSTFSGNSASTDGGAIFNYGSLTISNSTFSGNSATFGGAIFNSDRNLTISNSTFSGNSASNDGGAIHSSMSSFLTISNSTFFGNSATDEGGAIFNSGFLTISNSTFSGNSATNGGVIFSNFGFLTISNSTFSGNSATDGGAIFNDLGTVSSQDSHYENNNCVGTITDNGGNTRFDAITSAGCPGAVVIITPPSAPSEPTVTVLGCALDSTDGVEVANAPDNTYCRVLMKNGGVVSYSGAIPAQLIGLGVILAVDVYRLQGGATQNTFPDYARVCLAGQGRLFYMDSRNAPRVSIELASETDGNLTCGWIPAPGTLILTN
ncbi:MAG: hypothetical protein SFZ02_14430 [bacterium]|nr:hypothetical protein [bacterium]